MSKLVVTTFSVLLIVAGAKVCHSCERESELGNCLDSCAGDIDDCVCTSAKGSTTYDGRACQRNEINGRSTMTNSQCSRGEYVGDGTGSKEKSTDDGDGGEGVHGEREEPKPVQRVCISSEWVRDMVPECEWKEKGVSEVLCTEGWPCMTGNHYVKVGKRAVTLHDYCLRHECSEGRMKVSSVKHQCKDEIRRITQKKSGEYVMTTAYTDMFSVIKSLIVEWVY